MIDKLISTPVDKTVDFVGKVIKGLVIKGCGITGEVCIITFGLFVIWLVINKDSVIAKEGLVWKYSSLYRNKISRING